jgi:hypothetical protein
VWDRSAGSFPGYRESDRALVEIATVIRARLIAGEDVGMAALNHLRLCCGMMGGSPADRAKVTIVQEPEHDPLAHYFNFNGSQRAAVWVQEEKLSNPRF